MLPQGQLEDGKGHSKTSFLAQVKTHTADNTLDLVNARKERATDGKAREGALKGSLLQMQQKFVADWDVRKAAIQAEEEAAAAAGKSAPAARADSTPAAKVAQKWHEAVDAGTGRTYFWNSLTGETSWIRPSATALPEGWAEAQDGEGKVYYYHTTTGEVRWRCAPPLTVLITAVCAAVL